MEVYWPIANFFTLVNIPHPKVEIFMKDHSSLLCGNSIGLVEPFDLA